MGIPNKSDPLPHPPGDVDDGSDEEGNSNEDEDDEPIAPYFNLKATSPTNLKIQKAAARIVLQQEVSKYANKPSETQLTIQPD